MRAFEFKKAYWGARQDALPAGYRRVEYLESTGAQWIDTGMYLTDPMGWRIDAQLKALSGVNYRLFGRGYASANKRAWLNMQVSLTPKIASIGWNTNYDIPSDILTLDMNRHVFSVNWLNNRRVYVDGMDAGIKLSDKLNDLAMSAYIFMANNLAAPDPKGSIILYRVSVSNSEKVAFDLAPCVRTSDSKPGMYDLCGSICPLTGTPFYINADTGADFTYGELQ